MEVKSQFAPGWKPDREMEGWLQAGALFQERMSYRRAPQTLDSGSVDDYRRVLSNRTERDSLHRERGGWIAADLGRPYGLLFQVVPTLGQRRHIIMPTFPRIKAAPASVDHSHPTASPPSLADWEVLLSLDHLSEGVATPKVRYSLFKSDCAPVYFEEGDVWRAFDRLGGNAYQQTRELHTKLCDIRSALGTKNKRRDLFERQLHQLSTDVSPGLSLLAYITALVHTMLLADQFSVVVYRSQMPGVYHKLDEQVVESAKLAFHHDMEDYYFTAKAA